MFNSPIQPSNCKDRWLSAEVQRSGSLVCSEHLVASRDDSLIGRVQAWSYLKQWKITLRLVHEIGHRNSRLELIAALKLELGCPNWSSKDHKGFVDLGRNWYGMMNGQSLSSGDFHANCSADGKRHSVAPLTAAFFHRTSTSRLEAVRVFAWCPNGTAGLVVLLLLHSYFINDMVSRPLRFIEVSHLHLCRRCFVSLDSFAFVIPRDFDWNFLGIYRHFGALNFFFCVWLVNFSFYSLHSTSESGHE